MKFSEKLRSSRRHLSKISMLLLIIAIISLPAGGNSASAQSQQISSGSHSISTDLPDAGGQNQSVDNSSQNYKKDETVYGVLNHDGSVNRVEIVSHLYGQSGTWIDYGDYSELQNLTDDRQPKIENNKIIWDSSDGEDLYYQGTIEKNLPWFIDISWRLNGNATEADSLAGKSGQAVMHLTVRTDPAADEIYGSHYMLQISVPLDMDKARDITFSSSASQVVAGRTRTVSFTLLPGQSGDYEISFDAVDFSMSSIQITAIPTVGQSGFDELVEGINQISTGQQTIAEGTKELGGNLSDWLSGLKQISAGMAQAQSAGGDIESGLKKYYSGLLDFQKGLESIADSSGQFGMALGEYSNQGPALSKGYAQLAQQLDSIRISDEKLAELQQLMMLPDILPDGQSTVALKDMAGSLIQLNGAVAAIAGAMDTANLGLAEYTSASTMLSTNYNSLLAGIIGLPQSGKALSSGLENLKTGYVSYNDGLDQLHAGLDDSLQQGGPVPAALAELSSAQSELAAGLAQLEDEVSSILPDEQAVLMSFAAPGQGRPQSVQFIMTTPAISVQSGDSDADQNDPPAKTSFWQRLSELFG